MSPRRPRLPRLPGLPGLSLRWKIAALAALSAVAVALGVGVLVHHRTYQRAMDERGAEARVTLDQCLKASAGSTAKVRWCEGVKADPADLPPELRRRALAADGTVTAYDGRGASDDLGPWMWAARAVDGRVLTAKGLMNPDYRALVSLDRNMVAVSLLVLAVVLPLCALAAGLLARRLRRVSATADRLTAGDLAARTGPVRGRDEVAGIAGAVDTMADALVERLRDERRFTADVAHELRTPVTGLLSAADLLGPGRTEDLLRRGIRDLRDLVEDLLEISRLDSGAERARRHPVLLHRLVTDTVDRLDPEHGVTVTHTDPAEPTTDPRRLERILANLIANARRHGRPPVEIHVAGATVTVRDHGPGYPADLLAHGPRRFRTGAPERGTGHGLGLTIALAQARVIGAELRFANAPDGGALATLRLPTDTGDPGAEEHEAPDAP
ncbi:sensor histidine kinase (plasmid) [Streptomyces sp. BI20]|uniref:sensor histidine kinase n=1 Tax=Streptomyces sp. BI20 TaxID=3403460 RepID=UPI003C742DFC